MEKDFEQFKSHHQSCYGRIWGTPGSCTCDGPWWAAKTNTELTRSGDFSPNSSKGISAIYNRISDKIDSLTNSIPFLKWF